MIKKIINYLLMKSSYVSLLKKELDLYKTQYPPGHFYSSIVSKDIVKKNEKRIFEINSNQISGINLNEEKQLILLEDIKDMYITIPFSSHKNEDFRYYFENNYYSYSDAIFLHLLIRHFKPKQIIEIGSGYSSAVMLDTNEMYFNNSIKISFIEPYPNRLFSLCKIIDKTSNTFITECVENIDLSIFNLLNENDILFIDSTHVSKTGSDVNFILFEILPRLKQGVLIHFHDIFYPFEYPKSWVLEQNGFCWNEDYILKAFLMYNNEFEIILFNTFLEHFYENWFLENMPNCLKNRGGSIWLRKK